MSVQTADRDRAHLHPEFRPIVDTIVRQLEGEGFRPLVIETARSRARHVYLVSQRVTWTDWSFHEYCDPLTGDAASLAVDLIDKRHGWTKEAAPFFARLAELAEVHGCIAGHRWRRVDSAHIQAVPVATQAALRAGGTPDLTHLRM